MELCRQMPGCTVHLELKSTMDNDPDFVPRVLEVLQQTEMVEQVILVSFNHALLRQAKQLLPELRVGALVYGELESMLLPPPIIWKDLGLTNGMDDMEAMDAALPESAADEENCSWMTRWMSDKVSMLAGKLSRREPERDLQKPDGATGSARLHPQSGLCAGVGQL